MSLETSRAWLTVLLLATVAPATVQAAGSGKSATAGSGARAATLVEQSRVAYDAGRYGEALQELKEAYRLDPDPVLARNLVRCFEKAEAYDDGVPFVEAYLAGGPPADDQAFFGAALTRMQEARAARGAVGAVGKGQWAPGGDPALPSAAPGDDGLAALLAISPPDASPPPAGGRAVWMRRAGWGAAGLGAAALVGGVVLGIVAAGNRSDLDSYKGTDTDADRRHFAGMKDDVYAQAVTADVLLGTGVVLLGAAAAEWLWGK